MYNKRTVGKQFEQIAIDYLQKQGYLILEQNFQCKTGEIDIIAKQNDCLVFVEVKYRTNTSLGLPEEAVDLRKIRKITRTSMYYMLINRIPEFTPCRFDVVSILNNEIKLIQNAFEAYL
jgi:putative endonuclease